MAPKNLFQVLITDPQTTNVAMSEVLERNIASFQATYPDTAYRRYNDSQLQDFSVRGILC